MEAFVAPALVPVATFAFEESFKYIKGLLASSQNLKDRYYLLSQGRQQLLAIQRDRENQVQSNKHKDTTMVYCSWEKRVSNNVAEADELISKYETEQLHKWRLFRRSSLSEEMAKMHSKVRDLIEEGNSIKILADYKTPEAVLKVLDTPNIMEYPTLQSVLQEILGCLKNGQMKAIGVWGVKGVGKTTIMQNLNNSEEVSNLFNVVIFVTVLADHNLQQAIANRLRVDTKGIKDNTDEVARRIYKELKNKKYLLILDGVVDSVNLKKLGIPDNDNRSKVVMASQSLEVCNKNNMDRLIEVKRLQRNEAWKMFRHIVGPVQHRRILPTARRVCDMCSCLPLLIHKIGNTFKVIDDAPGWRAAWKDLDKQWRKHPNEHPNEGLEELYSYMEVCYLRLKDEYQKCFLYTSLYPADSKVFTHYLVECWAAQGFLGDVGRSYQEARDNGHKIIRHLVKVSLLEEREQKMFVTMSGCTRQLALYISSKHSHKSYVQTTNEEFEEPQEQRSWPEATWVSIIDTELCDLPISEDCRMLETLLLQKNSKLVTIPQTFFETMSNLLVLDLHCTAIRELPSTLSRLTVLKGLYLNDCEHLSELPLEIESLKLLQVLDIRGSRVSFIPSSIRGLVNLRCLRIPYIKSGNPSDHQGVEAANYNVISELHKLEELTIDVISHEEWCNRSENVMRQLVLPRTLITLSCSFPSKNFTIFAARIVQPRDNEQFTSFEVFIGWPNSEHPQILDYFEKGEAMGEVIHQTDAFKVICYKDITKLSDLEINSLNQVRDFLMKEGRKISTIVEGDENGPIKWEQLAKFEATVFKEIYRSWNMFLGALVS